MVDLLEPPRVKRKVPNLILHCGAFAVELDQVNAVRTPGATASWQPIPHAQLIQTVQRTLKATNLTVGTQAHLLTHDGMRYFGLMEILGRDAHQDYGLVLGLRNSHDKSFPAGIVAGASVFVCDNLSFSGEVKSAGKHTTHINRDLPQLTERAIGLLMNMWHDQDKRLTAYRDSELDDSDAHHLIIRSTDVSIISNRMIPAVLQEWREPRHQEFQVRNACALFNSFTEALKDGSLAELPKRTEALHGLLDTHVGLSLGSN